MAAMNMGPKSSRERYATAGGRSPEKFVKTRITIIF